MPFEAAIFDFDGVVANTETLRLGTYKALFKDIFGVDVKIDPGQLLGNPPASNFQTLLDSVGLKANITELQEARKPYLDSSLKKTQPVPSIGRLITQLQRSKLPIIIASNSNRPYIRKILNNFKGYEDIEVLDSGVISRKKPYPDIYLAAIEQIRVPAEKCLAFEDSVAGLSAAKSAGMKCVGVLSSLNREQLKAADFFLNLDAPEEEAAIMTQFVERTCR
jgi:HAD superfamily hydrolase (TIGR01509 family)